MEAPTTLVTDIISDKIPSSASFSGINNFFNGLNIPIIGTPRNPYFYAKHIAEVLSMKKVSSSIKNFTKGIELATIEDKEKYNLVTYKLHRGKLALNAKAPLLTEFGVYRLIISSNSEKAAGFKLHLYNVIQQTRDAEIETLKTARATEVTVEQFKTMQNHYENLLADYMQNPILYVFARKLSGENPYIYHFPDEKDSFMAKVAASNQTYDGTLFKYTLKPREEDYKIFTLQKKITGIAGDLIDDLFPISDSDAEIATNMKTSRHTMYICSKKIHKFSCNHKVIYPS